MPCPSGSRLFYNINYGRISAPHDEVLDAARRARIHETALRMPDGYDTLVGERGLKLSGGARPSRQLPPALPAFRPVLVSPLLAPPAVRSAGKDEPRRPNRAAP